MKQLVPTSIDEYIAEHKIGDVVSGRVVEESAEKASVELGENIFAVCRASKSAQPSPEAALQTGKADLSSLSSMLSARWKGSVPTTAAGPEPLRAGQIRSFRITKIDAGLKSIEVQLS
jgi:small subunit ribosomal protein S1